MPNFYFFPLWNKKVFDLQVTYYLQVKYKPVVFFLQSVDVLASQEHSGEIATVTIDQRKYFCQQ